MAAGDARPEPGAGGVGSFGSREQELAWPVGCWGVPVHRPGAWWAGAERRAGCSVVECWCPQGAEQALMGGRELAPGDVERWALGEQRSALPAEGSRPQFAAGVSGSAPDWWTPAARGGAQGVPRGVLVARRRQEGMGVCWPVLQGGPPSGGPPRQGPGAGWELSSRKEWSCRVRSAQKHWRSVRRWARPAPESGRGCGRPPHH
jgi:hypothetical protein